MEACKKELEKCVRALDRFLYEADKMKEVLIRRNKMSRCECDVCGKVFGSLAGFDKHRVGDYMPNTRGCLSDKELKKKGMHKNENGVWKLASTPNRTFSD